MDFLKRKTVKDFTAWDLNVPSIYKPHNYKKNKQRFKRKARRELKKELQQEQE